MISTQIDFSARLGAARDQGRRPTCLAFAGSDLNAEANGIGHLSVEYLCHHAAKLAGNWCPGRGFGLDDVLGAIRSPGQPLESAYPYQPDGHDTPLTEPDDAAELVSSSTARYLVLTVPDVVQLIAAGKPVGLVVQVSQSLMAPVDGVIAFDPLVLPDQFHALIGVGLGVEEDSGQMYLLVRNSWGQSWGKLGHAWLSTALLEILLVEGFLI